MLILSIIIPLYNTEEYIANCINSCIKQDLSKSDYEIIVIDDGSTDGSVSIVRKYQIKYSNIVIIHKENGGVSSARNLGIKSAKGEYILFVDSDDTIEENSLSSIVSELGEKNIEVLILNSYVNENKIKKELYSFPQVDNGEILTGFELYKRKYIRGSVCGVVFRKQFIINNKLNFSEKIKNGEDFLFMTHTFLYSTSISHFDLDFYKVTRREGSASRYWDYNKVKEMLDNLKEIEYFINNNILSINQLSILNIYAYSIISNALYYFFSIHRLNRYFEIKEIIKNSRLYPIKTFGAKLFKVKIFLLNLSIDMFCFPFLIRQIYKDIYLFSLKGNSK
jgi:glycosyltransferase involved in cell wall biosynthesis